MKEFLKLEVAINDGFVITPDCGTKDENGKYIASDTESLGCVIKDEFCTHPERPRSMYLSTIDPSHMTKRDVKVPTSCDANISIVREDDGKAWVRVQALGEDFVIGMSDIEDENGEVMKDRDYDTLMKRLNELHLDTFNRKQGLIIAIYIEEINAKLEEAGGDKFEEDWYASSELWRPVGSSADYNGNITWCFNGTNGCFNNNGRYYSGFRSRPVLAYSTLDLV